MKMNSGEIVRRVPYKKKVSAAKKSQNLSTAKKAAGIVGTRSTVVPTFEVNLLKSANKSTPRKCFGEQSRRYASPKPTNTLPKQPKNRNTPMALQGAEPSLPPTMQSLLETPKTTRGSRMATIDDEAVDGDVEAKI